MEFLYGGKCDELYKTKIRKKFCIENFTKKNKITCNELKNLNKNMSPLDHRNCYCEKKTHRCRSLKKNKIITTIISKDKTLIKLSLYRFLSGVFLTFIRKFSPISPSKLKSSNNFFMNEGNLIVWYGA